MPPYATHTIVVADAPEHTDRLKQSFEEMHLKYECVNVHTSEGVVPAFRLSMAACLVLATLNLVNLN